MYHGSNDNFDAFEKSKYVAAVENRDEHLYRMTQDDFNDAVLMDFEDTQFYAPKNWHIYLENTYGDYMTLPPEADRQVHDSHCKWI